MDVTKVIGIGIVGTFLAVMVRSYRPELGIGVAAATGLVIFAIIIAPLGELLKELSALCENTGISSEYFKTTAKIIGIAYITQYSSELAKDAGEGAISKKVEFAGKISVMLIMMPVVSELLRTIIDILMSF